MARSHAARRARPVTALPREETGRILRIHEGLADGIGPVMSFDDVPDSGKPLTSTCAAWPGDDFAFTAR